MGLLLIFLYKFKWEQDPIDQAWSVCKRHAALLSVTCHFQKAPQQQKDDALPTKAMVYFKNGTYAAIEGNIPNHFSIYSTHPYL